VNVPAEEIGDGPLPCPAFGHGGDHPHRRVLACIDLDAVELEEDQRADRTGPLCPPPRRAGSG